MLLAGQQAAVDPKSVDFIEDFHGQEAQRAAINSFLRTHEALKRVEGFTAVGGTAVVKDFPFHGASEWEPGVGGSEISRLDKKFEGLDL